LVVSVTVVIAASGQVSGLAKRNSLPCFGGRPPRGQARAYSLIEGFGSRITRSLRIRPTSPTGALMRPGPQTRALWEMFSDLMDLDDAHRYVADMLAGMDARYDLGDDHRFDGTLRPDMKLTLGRPDPDVVTAVNRSADLLREGCGLLLDLVDRAEARDAAAAWSGRVNTVTARTGRVDVDALLIRPDGLVAWALPTGRDLDATTLVRALGTWFGQPA
jgi:hypothetical protein